MKEMMIKNLKKNGFEPSIIGCTVQYTNRVGKTVVMWFDENDNYVRCEEWD